MSGLESIPKINRDTISEELTNLEVNNMVNGKFHLKLLYAVESGSRAWGFDSEDSDFDVRFIYDRPVEYYLRIQPVRNTVEWMAHEKLYDFSGWDLQKALFLMKKGNPALYEWLASDVVYWESSRFQPLKDVAPEFYNPRAATYHYYGMAKRNYEAYIRGRDTVKVKKYLYIIRPILACMHLERYGTIVPQRFDDLLQSVADDLPLQVRVQMIDLVLSKQEGQELGEGPTYPTFNEWIVERLLHFHRKVPIQPDMPDVSRLDEVFREIIGVDR